MPDVGDRLVILGFTVIGTVLVKVVYPGAVRYWIPTGPDPAQDGMGTTIVVSLVLVGVPLQSIA